VRAASRGTNDDLPRRVAGRRSWVDAGSHRGRPPVPDVRGAAGSRTPPREELHLDADVPDAAWPKPGFTAGAGIER